MTLLIATDLSPRSDRALHRAVLLARQAGRPLVVLHVMDDDLPEATRARQRAEAETAIGHQLAQHQATEAAIEIVEGRPHDVILKRAAALDARLVILGTHRDRGLLDLFTGTTAERVIRAGQRPVLMVCRAPAGPYARAVTGVDFSPHGIHAAGVARALMPDCAQRLVHVYDVPFAGFRPGDEADQEARETHARRLEALVAEHLAGGSTPPVETVIARGEPLEVLWREADGRDADLIVVGTRGQGGAGRHLLGSVAHELLADARRDVLVAHAPREAVSGTARA